MKSFWGFIFAGFSLGVRTSSAASAQTLLHLPDRVAQVSPSVVNIRSLSLVKEKPKTAEDYRTSLGSGFVVLKNTSEKGSPPSDNLDSFFILTNAHVVKDAKLVGVQTLGQKNLFKATLAGLDAYNDIAVLKAWLPKQTRPLNLRSSQKLRVGEGVFAIGNPFGLGHTVTSGILSAKDRSLGVGQTDRYLQTDAAVNFGNSGGPLFNMAGEVIGMNTLVKDDGRGIGFAIPSDTLIKRIPALKEGQNYRKPWVGISLAESNPAVETFFLSGQQDSSRISAAANLETAPKTNSQPKGFFILEVFDSSPASKVGLKVGDQVIGYKLAENEEFLNFQSHYALKDLLETLTPDRDFYLKIVRGNKTLVAKMYLEELPLERRDYAFD